MISSRGAGFRIPTRRVGSLFEMGADDPGLAEILRIADLGYEREPLIAVRPRHQMIVLGEVRVRAVGNAVLAGISRPQLSGDDLQIPFSRFPATGNGKLPLSRGITLPGGFRCPPFLRTKWKTRV